MKTNNNNKNYDRYDLNFIQDDQNQYEDLTVNDDYSYLGNNLKLESQHENEEDNLEEDFDENYSESENFATD